MASTAAGPSGKSLKVDEDGEGENDTTEDMNIDNSSMVITKMANLYAEKIMSDINLVVGNVEYPSHRLILCASSDVFQIMLHDSKWAESNETRIHLGETPSCSAVFEDFLKYLYTGRIHLDFATVVPIVSLADKYNVRDLLRLGLDYMERNVSTACKKNQVVSWYQITLAAGHNHVANLCREFIKANFELVANTIDFPNLDLELLCQLIQCNDLVIHDELRLFECVSRWLACKKSSMNKSGEDNVDMHFDRHVEAVLPHIRFPMMTPAQLADLLLNPLSTTHTELLVSKIRTGLNFHKGLIRDCPQQASRLYTPRLYTKETFCASLSVNHLHDLPPYHSRSLLFSSQKNIQDHLGYDQSEWAIDCYPRGVWFQRCLTVYQPPGREVPERVLRTVRVAVTTKEEQDVRVKIGILVVGSQENFEHVRCVKTRNFIFTSNEQIVNFDDIVDHDELNCQKPKSPFLSGEDRDAFKFLITIVPLTKLSVLTIP